MSREDTCTLRQPAKYLPCTRQEGHTGPCAVRLKASQPLEREAATRRVKEREKQLQEVLSLVTCDVGPCCRVRGHAGSHGDACERHDDTITDKPTKIAITELLKIVAELSQRSG